MIYFIRKVVRALSGSLVIRDGTGDYPLRDGNGTFLFGPSARVLYTHLTPNQAPITLTKLLGMTARFLTRIAP
jgi:hypothetical protein